MEDSARFWDCISGPLPRRPRSASLARLEALRDLNWRWRFSPASSVRRLTRSWLKAPLGNIDFSCPNTSFQFDEPWPVPPLGAAAVCLGAERSFNADITRLVSPGLRLSHSSASPWL